MYRILFLSRSLEIGGAERQLVELVKNMDHNRFIIQVTTFYDGGDLRPLLENIPSVYVTSLKKKGRWDLFSFSINLFKEINKFKPDVIQSYLDVPNSFNVIVGRLLGIKTSLGASASYTDFSRYDWTRAFVYKVDALLSNFSNRIIANSNAGKKYNIEHGYSKKKMSIIYNGIDTRVFRPDKSGGARMRSRWGIKENEKIVGLIGRIDPVKDHPNFLRSAVQVSKQFSECRFVCIGRGKQPYQSEMRALAASLLDVDRVLWIYDCEDNDIPLAFNAFDVLVSSSYGEGMPVVLGEGMSSGIPCVVTDVGDFAFAIDGAGLVVPPQNPALLAKAICSVLNLSEEERQVLGAKGRQRVLEFFSIEKMVAAYEAVYEELANS